jgi:hypothetical protein
MIVKLTYAEHNEETNQIGKVYTAVLPVFQKEKVVLELQNDRTFNEKIV